MIRSLVRAPSLSRATSQTSLVNGGSPTRPRSSMAGPAPVVPQARARPLPRLVVPRPPCASSPSAPPFHRTSPKPQCGAPGRQEIRRKRQAVGRQSVVVVAPARLDEEHHEQPRADRMKYEVILRFLLTIPLFSCCYFICLVLSATNHALRWPSVHFIS